MKNYFPVFHKLKSGAYSYVWTDKCEKLLPKHYKARCLDYMLKEPKPVHWVPDTRKYTVDEYGTRLPVQNHPIYVKYPVQCNQGLWAGEGIVQCWSRKIRSKKYKDLMIDRVAKYYTPFLVSRLLYSEILDQWLRIPCTNRAMDQIDDSFGLDYYILKTHERDLNSKLAMDLRRKMLLRLCEDAEVPDLTEERRKILKRYQEFMIPKEEAEWVGLSITEALEKAESEASSKKLPPLKYLIEEQFLKELKAYAESDKAKAAGEDRSGGSIDTSKSSQPELTTSAKKKTWFAGLRRPRTP